ncbi:hypothetical protein ACIGXM_00215 [Kitasatospora sp. NPDC052896]|uniref:hypothetical protein n=1 Tax=Kitasatospora sp. NPDC052896 TaxID=3364061 RepID=UPI0037CAD5C4
METRSGDSPSELKRDLEAALHTRKELGAEYESELVDSFLARIDARLDARVEQRVGERLASYGPAPYETDRPRRERRRWGGNTMVPISLVMAVPLTGIATTSGLAGTLLCWAGIVGVNFAAALGQRRDRQEEERRSRIGRSEWA